VPAPAKTLRKLHAFAGTRRRSSFCDAPLAVGLLGLLRLASPAAPTTRVTRRLGGARHPAMLLDAGPSGGVSNYMVT